MSKWNVHIGAHKTGTTHLQELLGANESVFLAAGVDVLRPSGLKQIVRGRGSKANTRLWAIASKLLSRSDAAQQKAIMRRKIQEEMKSKPITVLSHEDQLGFTQDLFRTKLYDGSERFWTIENLPDPSGIDIFISIRSFDTLFVSAFCEILKPFHDARERFERRLQTIEVHPPSWHEGTSELRLRLRRKPVTQAVKARRAHQAR